jgi:hypothetical protein
MAIFRIHKKGTRNFWHTFDTKTDQEFSDWNINIDHQGQNIILTMPNGATFPKLEVPIADVRVKVLTGSDETFATTELLRARLVEIGYNPLVTSGGSGAVEFTELLDVPSSYSGQGDKFVAVKTDESGLEFVDAPSGGSQNLQEVLLNGDRQTINTSFPISVPTFELGVPDGGTFLSLTNETLANDLDVVIGVAGGTPIEGMEYKIGNTSDYVVTLVPDTGITLLSDELEIPKNSVAILKFIQIGGFPTLDENTFSVTYQSNGLSGGGATDLGYTASPTNGIVTNSTGTDATIPLATGTNAGLLAPADFTKLGNQSGTNTGDQDLSGLMVKSNNLSDLTNTTTARSNLGLGTLATQSGTFTEKLTATKTLIQLTADQTNNTITLADITGFTFTLPAGKKAEVNINIGYNTSGASVGITTNINIVTASGANANLFGILETETRLSTTTINESTYMVDQPANTTTDYESFTGVSTTGINSFSSTAMLNNLATNTDVVYKIQFRSETAGQEIKLLKGSSMTITIY